MSRNRRSAVALLFLSLLLSSPSVWAEQPPPIATIATMSVAGRAEQGGVVRGTVPSGTATLTIDGVPVPFDRYGRFIVGFGREAGPRAELIAVQADGRHELRQLAVAPRRWSVQSLPTLPRGTVPSAVFLERRSVELAAIARARAEHHPGTGWYGPFSWPVTGRISGVFGSQRIYAGEPGTPHSGVDIARPTGTKVLAPADGVVMLAAAVPFTLEGRLLILGHGAGVTSAFLHLSRIDVRKGQQVRRGQLIGAIGTTGRSTGPHLHWAMMVRDQRVDPARLAGPMPPANAATP